MLASRMKATAFRLTAVVKRTCLAPKSGNMRLIKDQPSRLSASRLHDTGISHCESVDFLE